jgi:hypothetical protein
LKVDEMVGRSMTVALNFSSFTDTFSPIR